MIHRIVPCFLLAAVCVTAQEIVPRADAVKFAVLANLDLEKLADTPLPTDVDVKRPFAIKAEKRGALVVPEAKLTASAVENAGKEPVVLGQLWLAGLAPSRNGDAVSREDLKMITVDHDGRDVAVPVCVLAARKSASGALELLVYGKGKEPLLSTPLKASRHDQKMPIELSGEREGDRSARLTLNVLGRFEATVLVTGL